MLRILINTAAGAVSLYSTLCFFRIILTWIPSLNYSAIGKFLSSICDPYLNLFSRLPLRIGMFDFTAMIAIGILYVISSILGNISASGYISLSMILANLLSIVWSIASSIATVIMIIFIVRYLVSIFSRTSNQYDSPWQRFDDAIRNMVFKICNFFTGGRNISYKTALLIDSIAMLAILILSSFLYRWLMFFIHYIPF